MVHQLQNLLFVLNVVDMLALDDVGLLHGLERELLGLVLLQVPQLHISKSTYTHEKKSATYLLQESGPTRSL